MTTPFPQVEGAASCVVLATRVCRTDACDTSRYPLLVNQPVTGLHPCGEQKSIRRNLPSAQVNGNARPGNWPGVFVSLCWQRVTAFPPPTPALSIPQVRFWGPKATMTVALVARKNGRELSDSLVNRLRRVNSRVAFGTSSVFELVACVRRKTGGRPKPTACLFLVVRVSALWSYVRPGSRSSRASCGSVAQGRSGAARAQ